MLIGHLLYFNVRLPALIANKLQVRHVPDTNSRVTL